MQAYDPPSHYDRVTPAWGMLLGDELHYGLFASADEPLAVATHRLTQRVLELAQLDPGLHVLDVGCGTGAVAVEIGSRGGSAVGITTSQVGVDAARSRAREAGLADRITFELRDGMDNGFPDASFDRVLVIESSHLMRSRQRLISECARVLRPGGRVALCDIVLRRPLPFDEVKLLREPLALLRRVFGDAHMEQLGTYAYRMRDQGLEPDHVEDVTDATRQTFTRWRENADANRATVVEMLGGEAWADFAQACDVLEAFWDDGTLGYGIVAARRT